MYRTAAAMAPPDATVLCRACGAERLVSLEAERDDTFTCAVCQREQPVLRADGEEDLTVETLRFVSSDTGNYDDLLPFLKEIGHTAVTKPVQITVDCDGIHCLLSLSINSGSVVGLDMVARASGLPAMKLLRETMEHRDAEERGVVREVQVGDREFDGAVYIESPSAEPSVKTVFSSPGVRKATRELLRSTGATIDVTAAHVKLEVKLEQKPFDPLLLTLRLGWLRALAGAPRPHTLTQVEVPRVARFVNTIAWSLMPVGLVLSIGSTIAFTPMDARPWIVGVISGFVVCTVLQPFVTRALRGRATSLSEIKVARLLMYCAMPFLVTGVVVFTNGAFDSAEAKLIEMQVDSSNVDSDNSSKTDVHTTDEWGETHVYSFDGAPPPPKTSKVRLHVKPGALGWRWHTDSAVLVRGN